MEIDNWHSSFDPQKFLSRVNLENLMIRNETYNENLVNSSNSPCILCNCKNGQGILLNDKTYLCKKCFEEVSKISYPQVYEDIHRKYLKERESRKIAFKDFEVKYGYEKPENFVTVIASFSILLPFFNLWLIPIPIILFLISILVGSFQNRKQVAWNNKKNDWEKMFPEPILPKLRHFHDPLAILTDRDRTILKIFNNWPGYPPFWNYLREIVLTRDGNHCQVSGCPSRFTLHVHHKSPVANGGEHVPDNLVSLCDFHHALEPASGHERIWGTIKTRCFTIVRDHLRQNRASSGYHDVKTHIRRLELVKKDEIVKIQQFYSFSCPDCGCEEIKIELREKVTVECGSCNLKWFGPKELTEETGPRLAELFIINKNKGIWEPRWDMLSSRTENVFSSTSSAQKVRKSSSKHKTIKNSQVIETPRCPKCDSPMRLIIPKQGQRWNKFWSCTKYRTGECHGTMKF